MSASLQSTTFPNPMLPRVAGAFVARLSRWMSQPASRKRSPRGEDAAAVRAMAYSVQATDPGFAADLYAAAARHEGLDD
jgi:hypothetical protein